MITSNEILDSIHNLGGYDLDGMDKVLSDAILRHKELCFELHELEVNVKEVNDTIRNLQRIRAGLTKSILTDEDYQ